MKRLLGVILALTIMLTAALPTETFAQSVDDYPVLSSNFNTDAVQNHPPHVANFTTDKALYLQVITVYHWNNGNGASPGVISLYDADTDKAVGEFLAEGRNGNTYWDCYPDVTVAPGTYYIKDSGWETASWNSKASGGMMELRGYAASTAEKDIPQGLENDDSSSSSSTKQKYYFSTWAKGDIERAMDLDIIPESMNGDDLSEGISRAQFAAVAVKAYEQMSGSRLSGGNNPFNDTSDEYVLKAANADIVAGTSASTFSPYNGLTREQAAAMLTRVYKKTVFEGWSLKNDYELEYNSTGRFGDYDEIRPYARESVAFLYANGVISGVGGNMFAPEGTLTKEQAIAIAVRMLDKLDRTPRSGKKQSQEPVTEAATEAVTSKPVSPGGAVEGHGQGTLNNGGASITFSQGGGDVAVVNVSGVSDSAVSDTYCIAYTDAAKNNKATISIEAPQPPSGQSNTVCIGIPLRNDKGEREVISVPLETSYSNGKATAEVDFAAFSPDGEEGGFSLSTPGSLQPDSIKIDTKYALEKINVEYKYTNAYYSYVLTGFTATSKNFVITVDHSFKSYGVNSEDCKRILQDFENVYSKYESMGADIKNRGKVSVSVYTKESMFGDSSGYCFKNFGYIFAYIGVNVSGLENGYKRDGAKDLSFYGTIAHETRHYIQSHYVQKNCLWFDEADAASYEDSFAIAEGGSSTSPYLASGPDGIDAEYIYHSVLPNANKSADGHNGYGRRPTIDYIRKYCGGDSAMFELYSQGNTSSIQTWNDRILKLVEDKTGYDSLAFVTDFYTKFFNDKVIYASPWVFVHDQAGSYLKDADIYAYKQKVSGDTVLRPTIPAYGAAYMSLDFENLPADLHEFSITTNTANCSVIGFSMFDNNNYSDLVTYKPNSSENISGISVTGSRILLVFTNGSSSDINAEYSLTFNSPSVSACPDGTVKTSGAAVMAANLENGMKTVYKTGDASASLYYSSSSDTASLSISGPFSYSASLNAEGNTFVQRSADGKLLCSVYVSASPKNTSSGTTNPFGDGGGAYIRAFIYNANGRLIGSYSGSGGDSGDIIVKDLPSVDGSSLETAVITVPSGD